jgi:hypothetical protein
VAVTAALFLGAELRAMYTGGLAGGLKALLLPLGMSLVLAPLLIAHRSLRNFEPQNHWTRWGTRWNRRLLWYFFGITNLMLLAVISWGDLALDIWGGSR